MLLAVDDILGHGVGRRRLGHRVEEDGAPADIGLLLAEEVGKLNLTCFRQPGDSENGKGGFWGAQKRTQVACL